MRLVHTITVNAFVKPEDISQDPQIESRIRKTMKKFLPMDFDEENILLNTTKSIGFNNREIKIIEFVLHKESHTNIFLKNLTANLGTEGCRLLRSQLASRLDDELNFFIRLDKKKLLEGIYEITETGDCFHIKMTVAAFPKNTRSAYKVLEEIIK